MSGLSGFMERFGISKLLGMQFGGKRDLYNVFGYTTALTFDMYYKKYKRQDIAKRIVNAPASATWRNPPVLKASKQFQADWDELVQRLKLWGEIERVDRLAGLGNYAILFLGINDSKKADQPVVKDYANELLFVKPYSQASVDIIELDSDIHSPRYGLPVKYKIKSEAYDLSNNGIATVTKPAFKGTETIVHWTRVVHVAEDCLESTFLGTPRLESVYNLLDDLLKVSGGTSETYWLASNRGMQIDVDKEAELTEEDADALSAEVEEYQHELRRVLRTRGVKVNPLGGQTPDPKNTFDMIISLISGSTGIPKRVLTGSEAGQLASDQDRANWADRIKERRTTFAEPSVLLPLLTQLIAAGIVPDIKLTKIDYEWPPNFQLTPLEEAQSMAQKGRAAVNLTKMFDEGSQPICTLEEARSFIGLPEKPAVGKLEGRIPRTDPNPGANPKKDTSDPENDPENDPGAVDQEGND